MRNPNLAFLALILAMVGFYATLAYAASPADAKSSAICQEDESCFRWSTMGNLDRGVTLRKGLSTRDCLRTLKTDTSRRICVVDPCGFAHADMRGRIDWKVTPRLKGDAFARKHGCNPALYA